MMSHSSNYRPLAIVTFAISIASCAPGSDATIVGVERGTSRSLTSAEISVAYLPMPQGVEVHGFSPSSSAGGFIFSPSSSIGSVPYAWTSPYSDPAQQMAPGGYVGDEANDFGDVNGRLNGPGFWARDGSGWQFTQVNVGTTYSNITVNAVNNARSLAGYGWIDGVQRALWWSSEVSEPEALPLPVLTGTCTGSIARAMNNVGDIVGELVERIVVGRKTESRVHAVIWKRVGLTFQPILLNDVTRENRAHDVNDAGQVAGNASAQAVLWSPTDGVYGAAVIVSTSQGALSSVDRCGRVVGYTNASTPSKRRAWVWENRELSYLPLPAGAIATQATSITTDLTTGEGMIAGGAMANGQANNNSAFVPVRWTIPGCA
jgi:hypothetical protein